MKATTPHPACQMCGRNSDPAPGEEVKTLSCRPFGCGRPLPAGQVAIECKARLEALRGEKP